MKENSSILSDEVLSAISGGSVTPSVCGMSGDEFMKWWESSNGKTEV